MKFAIIAAGEGSRLNKEGIAQPKPLVPLCGTPMIARLVRIFRQLPATEIVIIVNEIAPETADFVRTLQANSLPHETPIRLVTQSTPSSMHSLHVLAPFLQEGPFCLTTVDTIFDEATFADYIHAFLHAQVDGMMAVTDYIDDESPLYVETDAQMRITGFLDTATHCKYISGGIYCLRPQALRVLTQCIEQGQSRMRNFQRALVTHGLSLRAFPFAHILDVDHASDIPKAEAFIQQQTRCKS